MALESRKYHHSTLNQKLHLTVPLDFFLKKLTRILLEIPHKAFSTEMGQCIRFVDDTDNEAYDEYIGFTRGNVLETFIGKTIRGYDRNSGESCQEVKFIKK